MDNTRCRHAREAQLLLASVDAQLAHAQALSLAQVQYMVPIVDAFLRRLRMGRSRRNLYGHVRRRLRALLGLCRATRRYLEST